MKNQWVQGEGRNTPDVNIEAWGKSPVSQPPQLT